MGFINCIRPAYSEAIPIKIRKILNNQCLSLNLNALSSKTCESLPATPPTTGRYINATISDADKTNINVTGSIPMNSPGTPGQNNIGKNAHRVVAVELTIGQNIRFAASP